MSTIVSGGVAYTFDAAELDEQEAPTVAPPVVHETVASFLHKREPDKRTCHLLGLDGRPLCGRSGMGLRPAHIVAGSPTASPCAGGCGLPRCPDCADQHGYPR